ncbi:MAG: M56 family metallopeptidase, partial [Lachnospiraceae bacterium]|nr:M56 family metallopeptidase [Lachnospiraceae bacterium]
MNMMVKDLFLKIIDMSYAGGWLMAAVILTRLLLRKAPRWMICLLWGLVAVRLICPFSMESTFSLIPEKNPLSEVMVQEPMSMTDEWQQNVAVPAYTYTGIENTEVEREVKPAGSDISVMDVLAFVWAAGVVLMLVYGVVSYYRIKKRTDISMNVRDNIYQCDAVDTPFILGMLHPRIFVPSLMDDYRMEYVVAHEKAHIRRYDHLWKPLGFVILCVYWFHPLCWISYILLCRDIELACDEYVVSTMTLEDKKLYAEALLSCSINKKLLTVCPLAFGEVGVKERIKSILHYKKPAFWILVISAAVCIIVALCFLTSPGGKKEELPVGLPEEGDSDENLTG